MRIDTYVGFLGAYEFAVMAFRVFLSMIILTCIQKATSVFLQALGKPGMAMGLSLLRDFILSVPFAIRMR